MINKKIDIQNSESFDLKITGEELMLILSSLGNLPYHTVIKLITEIENQIVSSKIGN